MQLTAQLKAATNIHSSRPHFPDACSAQVTRACAQHNHDAVLCSKENKHPEATEKGGDTEPDRVKSQLLTRLEAREG